jgi:hypothetical protein
VGLNPARRSRHKGAVKKPPRADRGNKPLHYKVIELSTVDEGAIEEALNLWTCEGWRFEGVQFAMRESSKRPAMAFIFFTREGMPAEHDATGARARLTRLAGGEREGGATGLG